MRSKELKKHNVGLYPLHMGHRPSFYPEERKKSRKTKNNLKSHSFLLVITFCIMFSCTVWRCVALSHIVVYKIAKFKKAL